MWLIPEQGVCAFSPRTVGTARVGSWLRSREGACHHTTSDVLDSCLAVTSQSCRHAWSSPHLRFFLVKLLGIEAGSLASSELFFLP